jgi:hypothetical protein
MMRKIAIPLVCTFALACSFTHYDDDSASRPERAIGTGATIMMPGEAAPSLAAHSPLPEATSSGSVQSSSSGRNGSQGQSQSHGSPPPPAGNGGTSSGTTSSPGGDGGLTMIGGASQSTDHEDTIRDVPMGPITAILGYPFWIFGKSVTEKADKAKEEQKQPRARDEADFELSAPPTHPSDTAEYNRVREENARMAEQLRERTAQPAPAPQPARSSAIRDELAALERSLGGGHPSAGTGSAQPREAVDRNADGHADLWAYRQGEQPVREVLDDDHDGRADRVLYYDEAHRLERSEEDLDGDGHLETLSQYQDGQLVRRRMDGNRDGQTDSWSFFEAGEIHRLDVDRDGDGFADLSSFYSAGQLSKEEEDRNGDGRPDLIRHYRDGEVVERAEDNDYDGQPEIRSFYERGKLVRKELNR